jgi:hypothetical protein
MFAVTGCVVDTASDGDASEDGTVEETAQAIAGDTVNSCWSNLTPSGWVDIEWWNTFACGSTFSPNMRKMKQLTGYPVGTTVNACMSAYPLAGWQIINSYYSSSCVYSPGSSSNNTWTLTRAY